MIPRRILGILAIVLVALIGLSTLTSKRRAGFTEGGGFSTLMDGVDTAKISVVKAWLGSAPDDPVELQRTSEGWVVSSRWSILMTKRLTCRWPWSMSKRSPEWRSWLLKS